MQRRSVEGSLGRCKVLGDLVPMGFRASVCIYVIDTNCLPDGKTIGAPSVVVLRILAGCWMQFCRDPKNKGLTVVVSDLSRLARNIEDQAATRQNWRG